MNIKKMVRLILSKNSNKYIYKNIRKLNLNVKRKKYFI